MCPISKRLEVLVFELDYLLSQIAYMASQDEQGQRSIEKLNLIVPIKITLSF